MINGLHMQVMWAVSLVKCCCGCLQILYFKVFNLKGTTS